MSEKRTITERIKNFFSTQPEKSFNKEDYAKAEGLDIKGNIIVNEEDKLTNYISWNSNAANVYGNNFGQPNSNAPGNNVIYANNNMNSQATNVIPNNAFVNSVEVAYPSLMLSETQMYELLKIMLNYPSNSYDISWKFGSGDKICVICHCKDGISREFLI